MEIIKIKTNKIQKQSKINKNKHKIKKLIQIYDTNYIIYIF